MTRILITGAPGWLGTRLVEKLCEDSENNVLCLTQPNIDSQILESFGAKVTTTDITLKIPDLKSFGNIDTVFHCAGIIHPKNVKQLYDVNANGTKNLLLTAVKYGARRFVYVSSNSVAGINLHPDLLLKEYDQNPYMNYGRSKLIAEKFVKLYQEDYGLETVILRPCWFYGERQPERQTKLFKMIKKGHPIMFGDGSNLRSMSYVDNVVQALMLAEKSKKGIGQTYWVADKRPYTTLEIYQTIARLLGVDKLKPRFIPSFVSWGLEKTDVILQKIGRYITTIHVGGEMNKNIACSIKKAERDLGYNPQVDLEEGMRRSIEWCRNNGIAI